MRISAYVWLVGTLAFAATAWGQVAQRTPHIGYAYPAGGRQGSALEVVVGGQMLRGVNGVYVTGEGVHASVIKHYVPGRNLMPEQRQELIRQLVEVRDKRLAEMGLRGRVAPIPGEPGGAQRPALAARREAAAGQRGTPAGQPARPAGERGAPAAQGGAAAAQPAATEAPPVTLPDLPQLRNLESMTLRQLVHVANELLNFQVAAKRQMNQQLAELVLVQVTIDANAPPGDRELRLATPGGLTNPIRFQVGTLPEASEQEPNGPGEAPLLPKEPSLDLPVVLNGQVMPGDVDRVSFRAKQGQRLVIEACARHLVPFLADAVPGWFQPTVAVYDDQGTELAFADDYLFSPDPVLFFQVPKDGEYELEIRDAIYRGREDFVYRVSIGDLPFITQAFPIGGRIGGGTIATVDGWNLPTKQLPLDTRPGSDLVREAVLRGNGVLSNEVTYAVDTLPECIETEPNDAAKGAQRIALPMTVNGRIGRPGDVDVFQIEGRAGDEVVAEVTARRLSSPLDSLLRVTDGSSNVLAWNDDDMQKDGDLRPDMGSLTHDADSYLTVKLPSDGTYYVSLSDTQNHGGDAYAYRLRISAPRPDFALLVTPSSLSMPAGSSAAVTVHVLRKDGFAGDINLALKDAPAGFALTGGRLPNGSDHIGMTVTAPPTAPAGPVALRLEGHAQVAGQAVSRPVVPAEDEMQAFLWRHLVPSQELLTVVRPSTGVGPARGARAGAGRGAAAGAARGAAAGAARGLSLPPGLRSPASVQVPAGGAAQVRVEIPGVVRLGQLHLQPKDPPEGVTIEDVRVVPGGVTFQLKVEGKAAKVGFAGNLIVEAFAEVSVAARGQNPAPQGAQTQRVSLGVLPAIPFVVVQP